MPIVQETEGEIVFIEKVPNGLRIFLALAGCIPMFLAPYELLIRPAWQGFSLFLVLAILISIGAFLVGGLFVAAGILGLDQTLRLAAPTRSIDYSYESALAPLRRRMYRFSDLARVHIRTHAWSDGPATYALEFVFTDGQKIETGSFETRAEAERYLSKVEKLIG